MKSWSLWWAPVLLLLAPLFGLVPAHRDLLDYFAPMRQETAERLANGEIPWLNWSNGCGEAWFANPQTGVLYPPHWLHAVLPPGWALTVEIALHLMLFSLGVGMLAREMGAGRCGRLLSEVVAWSLPPIFMCAGVLNNLETVAWVPLLLVAARGQSHRTVPFVALLTAMTWLAGAPTLWAMTLGATVLVGKQRWRTIAGLVLGVGLIALQLIPFLGWVAAGDRGLSTVTSATRGALAPSQLWGLLVPGATRVLSASSGFTETLFIGAPLLTLAALGFRGRLWLAAVVSGLGFVALLPALGGEQLYIWLTLGLVRYSSRFALIAVLCVVPLVGLGLERWSSGEGKFVGLILGGVALTGCVIFHSPWHWAAAGLPSIVLIGACLAPRLVWLRWTTVGSGIAGAMIASWPFLDLQPARYALPEPLAWHENQGTERLYVPAPSKETVGWLMANWDSRRIWPIGYLNLYADQPQSATYAPVADRRLAAHLQEADRGPESRWWLDTLGGRWVVTPARPRLEGIRPVRERANVWLSENLHALPRATVANAPPQANQPWSGVGASVSWVQRPAGIVVNLLSGKGGYLWLSIPPSPGWRWSLDGEPVQLEAGPGVLQFIRIGAGARRFVGTYRPFGIEWAMPLSATALAILGVLMFRGLRER